MTQLKRVLIMAGGTGGHVFPGLALADYLRAQGVDVQWFGTTAGLEAKVIPAANIPFHTVKIGGVRGKDWKTKLLAPWKLTHAVRQSLQLLKRLQPDVVVGMGGFVSGPGGLAAWLTRTPLIIHEQNAKAGFTNICLAVFAKKILAGFPNAFKPSKKLITVGNPVRAEIIKLPPPHERLDPAAKDFKLLVIGGSLGAQVFNEILPQALALLPEGMRPTVWHQTGEKHYALAQNHYAKAQISVRLEPFIKNMAQSYAWADMVLCRAGALTVAELCAAGRGAIFIPFPHAVDDHQTANADFMVKNQAAICIQQKDLSAAKLAKVLKEYHENPAKRLAMAEAAYQLRKTEVTKQIFDILAVI